MVVFYSCIQVKRIIIVDKNLIYSVFVMEYDQCGYWMAVTDFASLSPLSPFFFFFFFSSQ